MPSKTYPKSNHCTGTLFHNEDIGALPDRRGLWQVLRWRLADRARNGPQNAWPKWVVDPVYPAPIKPGPGQAAITFIGHASFLVRLPGVTMLLDPMFSARCSPVSGVGPRRARAPGLLLQNLPPIDVVMVSHNHYDHADLPSLRALHKAHRPKVVTLLGNAGLLAKAGLDATELDWWNDTSIGDLRITATPARHFSRRGARDANRALWGGFMLHHPAGRILFAGDSGMGPHWGEIGTRLGAPDVALLPIGAYEPRWLMAPVHMNPEEAVQAHIDLGARNSVGMHFGTFRLTDEAIDAPLHGLQQACADARVDNFTVLGVGETRLFDLTAA